MRSLINFFIRYHIWATMAILLVLVFGFIALKSLKSSFFPEFDPQRITIQVIYPGASPEEIEEGVVLKIENNLKGISGVERITSTSSENSANITVEVLQNYDTDVALQDVKNAVDRISSFPKGIEPPVVFKQIGIASAISFSLSGDTELKTLKYFAKKTENDLRAVDGISQISISGYPEEEIVVSVKESVLRTYHLTFDQVANAVRQANIDLSAGSVKTEDEEILLRFRAKQYHAEGLKNIIVKTDRDGKTVRLRDIANVKDSWAETPAKSFVNGKRSVVISVNKTLDEDILFIAEYVRNYVEEFNQKNDIVKASVLDDRTVHLRQRINLLLKNGLIGAVLVLLSLALAINLRLAFWVALGIPLAFMGMFIIGSFFGLTINVISLFGMILVVGILVDDGIIVGESIYQKYEQGMPAVEASINGTLEVLPSVFSAIITTIIAFLTFFFLEGMMGKFMTSMALVVILTLAISLVEVALILPSHLAHSKALQSDQKVSRFRQTMDSGMSYLKNRIYAPALRFALHNKALTLAMPVALAILTMGAMKGGIIGATFFPFIDSDAININLTMPAGTRENVTQDVLDKIEKSVWEVNEEIKQKREDGKDVVQMVRKNIASISISTPISVGSGGSRNSNIGSLKVMLLNGEERNMESFLITNAIREKVGRIEEAENLEYGGRTFFGKPVSISLLGNNLKELNGAKEKLKTALKEFSSLKDVVDNDKIGLRELNIKLKEKAYLLGLTRTEISRQIRQGFFGEEVQRLQRGDDEIKVWVRYSPEDRASIGKLEEVRIKLPDGSEYPLKELVDYSIKRGIVAINHLDGMREVKVDADLADQRLEVPPILNEITLNILPPILAEFPTVRVSFEGQKRETDKMQRSARKVIPIILIMMFAIIVLSFRSFLQAGIIMLLIPFGLIGVVWGHYLHGMPVSIMSAYGIIALTGIIVNDSIVLVNTINRLLRQGKEFTAAVYEAGLSRFRPILLTTITTVLGLAPLITEKSRQAQFLIPMAVAVAYGLMFATLITLIILPTAIVVLNKLKIYLTWLWEGVKPSPEQVEHAVGERGY